MTEDVRAARGGWAPGGYLHRSCDTCGNPFEGAKRARTCADCAYKEPEPMTPTVPVPTPRDKWMLVRKRLRMRADDAHNACEGFRERVEATEPGLFHVLAGSHNFLQASARLMVYGEVVAIIDQWAREGTRTVAQLAEEYTRLALEAVQDVFPNSSSGTQNLAKTYRASALADLALYLRGL